MVSLELINNCKSGGRAAFKELYESSAPYIYSIVKRYTNHANDHKDIMQESFAKIFSNLDSYDSERGAFKSWIGKIAINECFKYYNKEKKEVELKVAYKHESGDSSFQDEYDSLCRADIDALLERMPEGYKKIFMLIVIDGYSHKEVAELLSIASVTSRSQLMRAKNWIKKEIISEVKSLRDGTF